MRKTSGPHFWQAGHPPVFDLYLGVALHLGLCPQPKRVELLRQRQANTHHLSRHRFSTTAATGQAQHRHGGRSSSHTPGTGPHGGLGGLGTGGGTQ